MSEDAFIKTVEPLLKKKDHKTALKLAEKETKRNPENPFGWYVLGLSLLEMKKYRKAKDAFITFTKNKRANLLWGFSYLGDCYKGLKDYPKAIQNYMKALELDPKYKKALVAIEFCYRQLNDIENALKANEAIVLHYPRESLPWYWLCFLHLKKGDIKNALLYVKEAIRMKSKFVKLKEFTNAILEAYEEKAKTTKGISAVREMEFSDYGTCSLKLRDVGLTSLDQIIDLDYIQPIVFSLILDSNQLRSLAFTSKFGILNWLQVNDNNVNEISGLEHLSVLVNLRLNGNGLKEIVSLDPLIKLESLHLDDNEIQTISNLDKLANLRVLFLNGNQITKIEGLNNNRNLRTLSLNNNQIKAIDGLEHLSTLGNLYLVNNSISEIAKIGKSQNLVVLDLENNQIKDASGLEKLHKLIALNLANNQISSIKGLVNLGSLEKLDLSNNNLSTIDNLEMFPKLKHLNLENNPELPEYFAITFEDEKAIQKIRKYSGLSNTELLAAAQKEIQLEKEQVRIAKEKKRLELEKKREQYEQEAYVGSNLTTSYGSKQNLKERAEALLKLDVSGKCLYCESKIVDDFSFTSSCASAINRLLEETKISGSALDKNRFTERQVTEEVTNRRMDIYDRPGTTFVTRTIKTYLGAKIGRFQSEHLPKLKGSLCKSCSDEFTRKASRIFKRLRRQTSDKHFIDKAIQVRRNAHEDYMKLLESFIEKRRS